MEGLSHLYGVSSPFKQVEEKRVEREGGAKCDWLRGGGGGEGANWRVTFLFFFSQSRGGGYWGKGAKDRYKTLDM